MPATWRWLERRPTGSLLKLRTGGANRATLHASRCSHRYSPGGAASNTAPRGKACAPEAPRLLRWADRHGFAVDRCPDCRR